MLKGAERHSTSRKAPLIQHLSARWLLVARIVRGLKIPRTRKGPCRKTDSASGAFLRDTGICWSGLVLLSPPKIPGVMEFDEKAPLERWEHHGALIQQKIMSGT
jgi:hypothetical protein